MGTIRKEEGKITREYRAWKAMKSRCYSPSTLVGNYKKNNICVCREWKNDFEKFLFDMGKCPNGYSLDRIDNNGNYSKENCRWANDETQTSNRGEFNIIITYNEQSKTLKQWAKVLNIKYTTLYLRMFRTGLTFEDAIKSDPFCKLIEYRDKKQTMKNWCLELNLPYQTMIDRKSQGWSFEEIFETPIKKYEFGE